MPETGLANGPDVDLQAVEGIPRDTLVALLKRKDKEAKAAQAKLEKLEERYVKVVRFNKILMEDRASFQRFCGELLLESDGAFEEAAAQETPVNIDQLLKLLALWRESFDAASEDRKVFQQFAELVFPAEEAIARLFRKGALGEEAFDTLQQRWIALEDLHNQSIASVNAMAREQMMDRVGEIDAAKTAQREAERKVEELREQVTQLAREKAQMLTQKFKGGGGSGGGLDASAEASDAAPAGASAGTPAAPGRSTASAGLSQELRDLREAREAAERREMEAREVTSRREQDFHRQMEAQRAETARLKKEVDRLAEDSERARTQARKLLEQKDKAADSLQNKVTELEQELSSNAFIHHFAEQQAARDAEMKSQKKEVEKLSQNAGEIQRLLNLAYTQEKVLKDRIRELESRESRQGAPTDYLKHVVLKYMEYTQVGDLKAQGLVPVLSTLLSLTPEERKQVEQPMVPQGLLLLNQAAGGVTSWLSGRAAASEPGASPLAGGLPPAALPPASSPTASPSSC